MHTERQTKTTDRVAASHSEDRLETTNPESEPASEAVATETTVANEVPTWFRPKRGSGNSPDDTGGLAATSPPNRTAVRSADADVGTESEAGVEIDRDPDVELALPSPPKLVHAAKRAVVPRLIIPRVDDEDLDWRDRFAAWVRSFGTGFYLSFLLHFVVLCLLAFQYFEVFSEGPPGGAILGFSEDDGEAFDFGADDSRLQMAGGQNEKVEKPETVTVVQALQEQGDPVEETQRMLEEGVAADAPTEGAGTGEATGDGDAPVDQTPGGRKLGGNTITKGSFTVRVTSTDNKHPDQKPGENFDPGLNESYYIYIYVALDGDTQLRMQDIKGSIVEKRNDNLKPWHTLIPFHPDKRFDGGGGSIEGTDTAFYNPMSKSGFDPFVLVSERHYRRNSTIPVSKRRVGDTYQRYAVIRVYVPGSRKLGIRDQIVIECEPLDEKQEFEIVF